MFQEDANDIWILKFLPRDAATIWRLHSTSTRRRAALLQLYPSRAAATYFGRRQTSKESIDSYINQLTLLQQNAAIIEAPKSFMF